MAANSLREADNNLEIVGTVKKIDLEEKKSKKGKDMIIGSITMEVKESDKVHNIKVKVFSMKMNKQGNVSALFKGYKTVKDEWKPGDRARITGSLTINEYYGQSGSLTSFNEPKALFCNRLDEDDQTPDKAIATIELVVEGMSPKVDAEGIPTGYLEVDAFTVGYNSQVIPLNELIINGELGQQFQGMYTPGSTGKITMKINNYAKIEKQEVQAAPTHGFGSTEAVESNIVKDYESNLEIIGGDLPYTDGINNYSPEDIEQAHKNRELALQELQQNASAPAQPTANGFGTTGQTTDPMTNAFTNQPTNNEDPFGNGSDTPAF